MINFRKGVSPLLSGVFIILITSVISIFVVNWFVNLTQSSTTSVGNRTTQAIDCTVASLTIEDVYFDISANITRVSVKNSGYTNDAVTSAVVLNNAGTNAVNMTEFPILLSEGDYATIEFNTSVNIESCSNFSRVIVSTRCSSAVFDSTPKNC
jgi:hypothetical protein